MIAYPKSLVGRMGHINETCGNRGMLHPASSKELKATLSLLSSSLSPCSEASDRATSSSLHSV